MFLPSLFIQFISKILKNYNYCNQLKSKFEQYLDFKFEQDLDSKFEQEPPSQSKSIINSNQHYKIPIDHDTRNSRRRIMFLY